MKPETIAIIPARGGSTRIPRKNIRQFHGKPIIAYSIEKAKATGLFTRVVVSTEDAEIAAVAQAYGAEVWTRNPDFSRNEVGTQEVARDCLVELRVPTTALVCVVYPTAPLMNVGDLAFGYRMLMKYPDTTYVFSVGEDPLHDAGQFYWGHAINFLLRVPLVSVKSRILPISWQRDCDINTEDDWKRAEEMFLRLREDK